MRNLFTIVCVGRLVERMCRRIDEIRLLLAEILNILEESESAKSLVLLHGHVAAGAGQKRLSNRKQHRNRTRLKLINDRKK